MSTFETVLHKFFCNTLVSFYVIGETSVGVSWAGTGREAMGAETAKESDLTPGREALPVFLQAHQLCVFSPEELLRGPFYLIKVQPATEEDCHSKISPATWFFGVCVGVVDINWALGSGSHTYLSHTPTLFFFYFVFHVGFHAFVGASPLTLMFPSPPPRSCNYRCEPPCLACSWT
jgi:hypothetical protein